eukprot:1158421-Pelagomonas_calceolata.AAC.13
MQCAAFNVQSNECLHASMGRVNVQCALMCSVRCAVIGASAPQCAVCNVTRAVCGIEYDSLLL